MQKKSLKQSGPCFCLGNRGCLCIFHVFWAMGDNETKRAFCGLFLGIHQYYVKIRMVSVSSLTVE